MADLRGYDVDATDDFGATPLMVACEAESLDCAQRLIDEGADTSLRDSTGDRALQHASTRETVELLLANGETVSDLTEEGHAALVGIQIDGLAEATREEYAAGKHRRFGRTNRNAWKTPSGSAWCAVERARTPRGVTTLTPVTTPNRPHGAFSDTGERRPSYLTAASSTLEANTKTSTIPDFCIYSDVTVFDGKGGIEIYGYPEDVFPPTDFHTATLVGPYIYVIGSLGYRGTRRPGHTPVYRLDTRSMAIRSVKTTGDAPGWISEHTAKLAGGDRILVRGGVICAETGERDKFVSNEETFELFFEGMVWRRWNTVA